MYKKIMVILIYLILITTSFLTITAINAQADIFTIPTFDTTNFKKKIDTLKGNLVNCKEINNPPDTPNKPNGPITGEPGIGYTYTTYTTDPDGDKVRYGWEWTQDDNVDGWTMEFYNSGQTCFADMTFILPGTYNIRVKAEDILGAHSAFSQVLTVVVSTKTAPSTPIVIGPPSGNVRTSYTFSATSTDFEGDLIYYWFDWGDGTNSSWLGPYLSGKTANATHVWMKKGNYSVQVKAKDYPSGLESGWETKSISLLKTKSVNKFLFIYEFFAHRLSLFNKILTQYI